VPSAGKGNHGMNAANEMGVRMNKDLSSSVKHREDSKDNTNESNDKDNKNSGKTLNKDTDSSNINNNNNNK